MTTAPITKKREVTQLLRAFLLEQDSVTSLVSDRIRTAHVQDPDTALAYPLVVFDVESGRAGYQGGIATYTVDVYTYSDESQDVADGVYDAVFLAMQAARLWDPSGVVHAAGYVREVERPSCGWNEQTRSWYARGTWIVTVGG